MSWDILVSKKFTTTFYSLIPWICNQINSVIIIAMLHKSTQHHYATLLNGKL